MALTEQQGKQACARVMAHTPGPWGLSNPYRVKHGTVIDIDKDGGCIVTVWGGINAPIANAKLIAAAPDMLDLLTKIASFPHNHWGNEAQKLIDKATK